jgi:predicted enzyme related to lactoylglutathione lyase
MFTPKGKFGWYELMTSDTKAAGKFYSDVVGWSTKEMPGGDGANAEHPRPRCVDWLYLRR